METALDLLRMKGERPLFATSPATTVLEATKQFPGEIIPFCTLDPKEPDNFDRLKKHVAMGAKGLKIYTGHSNFYDGPLNTTSMDPVLSYLQEIQLPINWHINLRAYR